MESKIENTDPHFDISAAVVRQLGEELVTDEVTAIMELVKNSYDACASWVKIEVNSIGQLQGEYYKFSEGKGFITIEDNGFGMNDEEIRKGWMIISLSSKREMKEKGEKTRCGRTPLGDKGLGRLSTQRLGQRLEMFTSKENEPEIHHVAFDWADFKEDTPLTGVPMHYKNLSKEVLPKGTKLILTNLKDPSAWEGQSADKFKGQLSQLIFPFKENRTFHVFLTINNERVDLDEINEALRNQAVSRFQFAYKNNVLRLQGSVKTSKLYTGKSEEADTYQKLINIDNGRGFFSFLIDKDQNRGFYLNNIEYTGEFGLLFRFNIAFNLDNIADKAYYFDETLDQNIFATPGDFWGEIDDFNLRDGDALDSAFDSFAQYKNIVKNQVGVRVFRDGFGIKPFGIDGNDWLNLGGSWTSGASYYGLRPSNTIGFVAITADQNKNLKEKTDREGFMDTPYSKNFFLLMNKVIRTINDVLLRTRRSYNDYKKVVAQQTGKITDIKDSFQRLKDTSSKANIIQQESYKLTPALAKVSYSVKQVIRKVENTRSVNAEDSEHRKLLLEIDESLQRAIDILAKIDSILEVAKQLEHDANYIRPKVEDLENQLSEFAELAGLGLTAEALSHEISNIINRLLEQTNNINRKIKGREVTDTSPVFVYIEYVKSTIQSLRKQLSHLAPSLRYVRESKEEISLNRYFEDVTSYYNEKFENLILIEMKYPNYDFKVKMSRGKLTQIIDNIVLNAEYWLKERKKAESNFKPKITIELIPPFVRMYDNGFGIEPSFEQRVFQPFVTAKPKHIGRGLGLFIVQQLLDTVGSEILLLNDRNNYGNRYIFQINFSSIVV